jgi:hypothetical protein
METIREIIGIVGGLTFAVMMIFITVNIYQCKKYLKQCKDHLSGITDFFEEFYRIK